MDYSDDKYLTDLFSRYVYYPRIDGVGYANFQKVHTVQGNETTGDAY